MSLDIAYLRATVLIVVTIITIETGTALQVSAPHGRLFPPEDLGLLEGPDRDAWQKPEQIMDALAISDGSKVAEEISEIQEETEVKEFIYPEKKPVTVQKKVDKTVAKSSILSKNASNFCLCDKSKLLISS